LLDTGADATAIRPQALAPFALASVGRVHVQTAGGIVVVDQYEIGLTVEPAGGAAGPRLERPTASTVDLLSGPFGLDGVIGMDILGDYLFILDGPGGRFTLAF
jgi:hypothetical protein